MTTLVEALQRKFDALVNDEITPECNFKPRCRTRKFDMLNNLNMWSWPTGNIMLIDELLG